MTEKNCIPPLLKQCFLSVGGTTVIMGSGFVGGVTSMYISQLNETKVIEMDEVKVSWFASIAGISAIFGMVIAAIIMKYIGRKLPVMLAAALMVVGWIFTYASSTYGMLLFGRIILGLGLGIDAVAMPIYLSECISPKYRGCLLATVTVFLSTGVFGGHVMGNVLSWQKTAAICSVIECIAFCILIICPDSPSFLALQGKYEKCEEAFRWLRGYSEDEELENLIRAAVVSAEERVKKQTVSVKGSITHTLQHIHNIYTQKHLYKPVIIVTLFNLLSEWAGGALVDHYTIDVTKIIAGESSAMSLIIYSVDVQRILSNFLVTFIYKVVSRRRMIATIISLNVLIYYVIAIYVYAKKYQLLLWDHPWLGGGLIHLHMFTVSLGAAPLNIIIYSEISSLEYKDVSAMMYGITFSLSYFINMKTVPYLFSRVGLHGSYFIFGTIVLVCMIAILCILPETKDKTLQEIEESFKCGNISTNSDNPIELEAFVSK